jgi:hypothetical protein
MERPFNSAISAPQTAPEEAAVASSYPKNPQVALHPRNKVEGQGTKGSRAMRTLPMPEFTGKMHWHDKQHERLPYSMGISD